MPRAGLSKRSLVLLTHAVADDDVESRYRSKVLEVGGSSCLWWTGAVSARGHGRFWLGDTAGDDVVLIAHRFAWALQHGVDDLLSVPVLGHRCDNPLCQRIDPKHVQRSSPMQNAREWAARRHTLGGPLRDSRGARGRSRDIRDQLREAATPAQLSAAIRAGLLADQAQLPLWEDQ